VTLSRTRRLVREVLKVTFVTLLGLLLLTAGVGAVIVAASAFTH